MTRPGQQFAFDSKYDFSYRPVSYWPDAPNEETTLAKVKGTARRDLARQALEQGKDTPVGEIDIEFAFTPSLSNDERTEWGRIHPALMGGEFLPDPSEDEVEVARIELQSTTGDVIQVLARRSGPGAKRPLIRYRIVDEYWHEGSRYAVSPRSSKRPLNLRQLIDLIDGAEGGFGIDQLGLVDGIRQSNYELGEDVESLRHFVDVSSPFYPQLAAYYDDRAEDWFLSVRLEWLEDACLDARHYAERSRRMAGDELAARDGWALLDEGSVDEAERLFSEAAETDALLGLAAVAKKRGDRNLALSLYDQWNRQ